MGWVAAGWVVAGVQWQEAEMRRGMSGGWRTRRRPPPLLSALLTSAQVRRLFQYNSAADTSPTPVASRHMHRPGRPP